MTSPPGPTDTSPSTSGRLRGASPNGLGIQRLTRTMRCSLAGLRIAFTNESAFRQEVALAAVLIPAAVVLPFSAIERFLLVGAVLLVLIVELLNTAIEIALDRISTDQHRLTGAAKDIGSAAVLLSFIVMAIAWASIAAPVILGLILQSF